MRRTGRTHRLFVEAAFSAPSLVLVSSDSAAKEWRGRFDGVEVMAVRNTREGQSLRGRRGAVFVDHAVHEMGLITPGLGNVLKGFRE